MNSVLFDFRTAKEEWFDLAVNQYTKKINYFSPFQIVSLKTLSGQRDDRQQKIKFEQEQFEKKITADDYFVLFDETGKTLSSESFSEASKDSRSGKEANCLSNWWRLWRQ
jgi:23S rRNA (pseudouridine1915-N3)-methyltransferase